MTNKNKRMSTIENNDIFIYFSIALVTVILMLIAPMLNKGIYAKTSTLPADFEKGKATQNAITEESGKALETYMKPYEDSVNMTKSYQEENKKYLHNQRIDSAEQEKLQIDEYNGPRINEHKNFLPEGYFWDEGAKKMKELLAPNESDGKIDTKNTNNVNFAQDLLNPYAGILCFYEGKRLPSGSQISAEMYKAGLSNTVGGMVTKKYIFDDDNVINKMKQAVEEQRNGYTEEKGGPLESNVTQPDFAQGGMTMFFAGTGLSYKDLVKFGENGNTAYGEGLKVGASRGLGLLTPVVKADKRTVDDAIKRKEDDDRETLNKIFDGEYKSQYVPFKGNKNIKKWDSIWNEESDKTREKMNYGVNYRITNKDNGNTDIENDGLYEDITGGHNLSVEKNIIADYWSFPGLMSQLRTRCWGDGKEYIKDVIQDTKKPGQAGVDSLQKGTWGSKEVDHMKHPNAGTTPKQNKDKAARRKAINEREAKKFLKLVDIYQDYQDEFEKWMEENKRDLPDWNTDGKTAKVINHPKEPQIRYILPVGFHQDKEITTEKGDKVKAPNPKLQYQPKIESADPKGKSLKEVSKVKFDTRTQKWLIGPYRLKYFTYQMTEEKVENFDDPTKQRPKGFKVGKRDNDNLLSDITEIQLYGVYENDLQNPQKENPNKTDKYQQPIDSIDPNRFGMKASDDSKYKFIKSWSFLTEHGELEPTKYPKSGEAFYFAVKYDPALHKIAKARFVFGYMVQGVKYEKVTGTYNAVLIRKNKTNQTRSKESGIGGSVSVKNGTVTVKQDGKSVIFELGKNKELNKDQIEVINKHCEKNGKNYVCSAEIIKDQNARNILKKEGLNLNLSEYGAGVVPIDEGLSALSDVAGGLQNIGNLGKIDGLSGKLRKCNNRKVKSKT